MSMVPLFFRDMWTDFDRFRSRRNNFSWDTDADDFFRPYSHLFQNYYRPWGTSLVPHTSGAPSSTVTNDKEKLQLSIDVQQFKPEEIVVKTTEDNFIVIEGKHEEKKDDHGYISRHFVRRYKIPEGHDVKNVNSTLSSDGVLTIIAPKLALPESKSERIVPIVPTGPMRSIAHQPETTKIDVQIE